jgi:predicted site-specific integrase-resolvase
MEKKRKLMTLAQAGPALGVTRDTVLRWCREGCPHRRVPLVTGGAIAMVVLEEVRAWRGDQTHGNTNKIKPEVNNEQ